MNWEKVIEVLKERSSSAAHPPGLGNPDFTASIVMSGIAYALKSGMKEPQELQKCGGCRFWSIATSEPHSGNCKVSPISIARYSYENACHLHDKMPASAMTNGGGA